MDSKRPEWTETVLNGVWSWQPNPAAEEVLVKRTGTRNRGLTEVILISRIKSPTRQGGGAVEPGPRR